jgi:hypothetical protein
MNPDTNTVGGDSPAAEAWAQMLVFITGQDRLRALRLELDLGVGKSELLIKLALAPMTLREVAQAVEVDPSAATARRILTDPPPALAALAAADIAALTRIFANLNTKPQPGTPPITGLK